MSYEDCDCCCCRAGQSHDTHYDNHTPEHSAAMTQIAEEARERLSAKYVNGVRAVPKKRKEKVNMEELNGLIKSLTEKLADAEKVVKPKTGKILLLASAAFAAYKLLQSKSSTKTKSK